MGTIRAWFVALLQWFSRCFASRRQYTDDIPTSSPGATAAPSPSSAKAVKHDHEAVIPTELQTPSPRTVATQHPCARGVSPLLPPIAQHMQAAEIQAPEHEYEFELQLQAPPTPQQPQQAAPPTPHLQQPSPSTPQQLPTPLQQHRAAPTSQPRIPLTPLQQTPHAQQQLPDITPLTQKLQQTVERQVLRDVTPSPSQAATTPGGPSPKFATPGAELAPPPTQPFRRYMVDSGKVVGVNNTVARYREAKPIMAHTTPFPLRVDRELQLEATALGANNENVQD